MSFWRRLRRWALSKQQRPPHTQSSFAAAAGVTDRSRLQGNIRATFRALHDVVKAQGLAIRNLETQMATKATAAEVAAGFSSKVNENESACRACFLKSDPSG